MLGDLTDSASYDLDITAGGKHRKVRVYAPFDVHDKKSLRRFRHVWEAVFRPIPQPDQGDAIHHLRVNS
jgi:predicted phosphoadenosine phosphosulfate sulfurtransferase